MVTAVTRKTVTNEAVTTVTKYGSPRDSVRTAVRIAIACDDDINWRLYLVADTRAELRAAQKSWRDIESPTPGERACVAQFDRRQA
jgi:hypothetical protein